MREKGMGVCDDRGFVYLHLAVALSSVSSSVLLLRPRRVCSGRRETERWRLNLDMSIDGNLLNLWPGSWNNAMFVQLLIIYR